MLTKIIIVLTAISLNIAFNYKKIIAAQKNIENKKSVLQLDSPDVWISSGAKGIEKYNVRKKTFEKYDINRSDLLKIIKNENNYIIINRSGITKIDGKTKELSSITLDTFPKDIDIECLTDNEKGLYVGLKGIIGYYDYKENKWQNWKLPDDFDGLKIISIVPLGNLLFIITDKNILKFDPSEKDYRLISDNNETIKKALISKNKDSLYILTDKGVSHFDLKTYDSEPINGLDNKNIKNIWLDETEYRINIWLAGEGVLFKYDPVNKTHEDFTKECLISELSVKGSNLNIENVIRINDLKIDNNTVWLATNGGGVIEINTNAAENKTRRWTEMDGLPSNFIESLAIDDNRIFACFNDGLARMEKNKGQWDVIRNPSEIEMFRNGDLKIDKLVTNDNYYGFMNNGVLFLYMRKEGKWIEAGRNLKDAVEDGNVLWLVSVENKIIKYDLEGKTQDIVYPNDKFQSKIVCPLISDKNYIYAGTTEGVFSYNKKDKIWEQIFNAESKIINCLADDYIFIWIGTRNNGVARYDKKSKKVTKFGRYEGMLEDSVSLIGIDQEYIWVVHENQSISRMSKMTNYWDTYKKIENGKSKIESNNFAYEVNKFIPNEVLNPLEKRWQIEKDWKITKEITGGLGGKWIEGEIPLDLNPTQIFSDKNLPLTWFVNDKSLIKYNREEDSYKVEAKDGYLIKNDNKLSLVFEKYTLKVIDTQLN